MMAPSLSAPWGHTATISWRRETILSSKR